MIRYYIVSYLKKERDYFCKESWVKERRVFKDQIEHIRFKTKIGKSSKYKDIKVEVLEGQK